MKCQGPAFSSRIRSSFHGQLRNGSTRESRRSVGAAVQFARPVFVTEGTAMSAVRKRSVSQKRQDRRPHLASNTSGVVGIREPPSCTAATRGTADGKAFCTSGARGTVPAVTHRRDQHHNQETHLRLSLGGGIPKAAKNSFSRIVACVGGFVRGSIFFCLQHRSNKERTA